LALLRLWSGGSKRKEALKVEREMRPEQTEECRSQGKKKDEKSERGSVVLADGETRRPGEGRRGS
jgi:hypothetical protein